MLYVAGGRIRDRIHGMKIMENLFNQSAMIKEEARRLGFDGCGISRAEALKEDAGRSAVKSARMYAHGIAKPLRTRRKILSLCRNCWK